MSEITRPSDTTPVPWTSDLIANVEVAVKNYWIVFINEEPVEYLFETNAEAYEFAKQEHDLSDGAISYTIKEYCPVA